VEAAEDGAEEPFTGRRDRAQQARIEVVVNGCRVRAPLGGDLEGAKGWCSTRSRIGRLSLSAQNL